MGKDPFDKFMSNYAESTPTLNTVVEDSPAVVEKPKKAAERKPAVRESKQEITVEQRQALAEARNEHRGRPAEGDEKVKKTRIGFQVDPTLAENFKMVSYRTGIPFGQLYEEAMSDLIKKYSK